MMAEGVEDQRRKLQDMYTAMAMNTASYSSQRPSDATSLLSSRLSIDSKVQGSLGPQSSPIMNNYGIIGADYGRQGSSSQTSNYGSATQGLYGSQCISMYSSNGGIAAYGGRASAGLYGGKASGTAGVSASYAGGKGGSSGSSGSGGK